ncbi:MAG: ATP-binding protein [Acidobacteriota bacterium]
MGIVNIRAPLSGTAPRRYRPEMTLAVASGKGGTGKTTVALNLARVACSPIQLLDCDVEAPNAHLFVGGSVGRSVTVSIPVPEVDPSRCDGCGKCSQFCQFHAIVSIGTTPLVFPELCHGCGGCALFCSRRAIRERPRRIGVIEERLVGDVTLVQGRLDVGVALAPPLIRAVKGALVADSPAILDAPPGTSCPVVTTLLGTDFVVLVTEPTRFGLHDLSLAVDMVRALAIPFGVVVNRVGVGDGRVHRFCRDQGIPILLEIPDDRRIAEAYARGKIIVDALPEYRERFEALWDLLAHDSRFIPEDRDGGLRRRA